MPEKKKICMSPAEKGTCSDSLPRYRYDVNMAKCLPFEYSQYFFFKYDNADGFKALFKVAAKEI